MSKIEFRTGAHNPYTLYVAGQTDAPFGGRGLPGWMRETPDGGSEWFLGSLPYEALAMVTVEALNAFVCQRCSWGCKSCSLNRATCECYDHQEIEDPFVPFSRQVGFAGSGEWGNDGDGDSGMVP